MAPRIWLLSQGNTDLKRDGIFVWSLPAFVVRLSDGTHMNVCPQAGECASVCYALNGTYRFPTVKQAHTRKLEMTLDDLPGWQAQMAEELRHRRYRGGKHVRIHDGGDFYSEAYLRAWLAIAAATPDVIFYAYTKEVALLKRLAPEVPSNLRWLYSTGGKQDHLIDRDVDRHAEVFPDAASMEAAGYTDQGESDLLAIYHPNHRVGIIANNIPAFRKRMDGRSFGEMQAGRDEARRARLLRLAEPACTCDGEPHRLICDLVLGRS